MAFLLTETAFAALSGSGDQFTVTETVIATQTIVASDSAGLSEVTVLILGNALLATENFSVAEPASLGFGITETDSATATDALTASSLGGLGQEIVVVSESQTGKTSAAQIITSSEQGIITESAIGNLGVSAAQQAAMQEAIRALLDSVASDNPNLLEIAGPSFGVPALAGLAMGTADLEANLLAASGVSSNLTGTANVI